MSIHVKVGATCDVAEHEGDNPEVLLDAELSREWLVHIGGSDKEWSMLIRFMPKGEI